MSDSWYGVKSVYETTIVSAVASAADESFDRARSERLIEERVVLIRAEGTDEAMIEAEEEAHRYAHGTRYRNADGDLVETRYLGSIDVFTIDGSPGSGKEVYSSLRVVTGIENAQLLDLLLGRGADEDRMKYEPDSPAE